MKIFARVRVEIGMGKITGVEEIETERIHNQSYLRR